MGSHCHDGGDACTEKPETHTCRRQKRIMRARSPNKLARRFVAMQYTQAKLIQYCNSRPADWTDGGRGRWSLGPAPKPCRAGRTAETKTEKKRYWNTNPPVPPCTPLPLGAQRLSHSSFFPASSADLGANAWLERQGGSLALFVSCLPRSTIVSQPASQLASLTQPFCSSFCVKRLSGMN